jgi:hypothetical protein
MSGGKGGIVFPGFGSNRTDLVVDIGIAKLDFMFETLAT